ncbi:MAG: Maltooligosyl trehalose synthase [Chlamydiales bacterium]|nr:Maltooligosyl trehalose synthase [Chlamydiales bacterium]
MNLSDISSSVYRLQLNADFSLKKAIEVLPYLEELGVEGVYCSPFYDAYSAHGYDITNPNALNPKIGTPDEYAHFCSELKRLGLKQIIDVVPNHMGICGGKNAWWQDVLEKGPHSEYARFFDINWNPEQKELTNRVLLPILESSYTDALENKEIQLHQDKDRFWLQYKDFPLPLARHTYGLIGKLDRLLEAQYYRLAHWKAASEEINYRRFFNIHELAAIRIEDQHVLDTHHKWLFQLIEEGHIQGLRIDHPDGLYDPVTYLDRLREKYPIYTVVEKILERDEPLPENWKVEGTVGYDYLNVLNGLFIQQSNEQAFDALYQEFLGDTVDFDQCVYHSKKTFALKDMHSEVHALGLELYQLSESNDFTRHDLARALVEVIACFPVYRTYTAPKGEISRRDQSYIRLAIEQAKSHAEDLNPSLFDFLEQLLLLKRDKSREFVLRFQQLTGPLMAKGLEDTAFYVYNRLISLNEVGGDPPHFGCSLAEFHRFNQEKQEKWPLGFLATSTHDTKRSEDVRARLNVLSEIPEQWRSEVMRWHKINSVHRGVGPSPNAEYLIYQLLVGVWPQGEVSSVFTERLWGVVLKSLREAKQETSWNSPNEAYEKSVRHFFYALLNPDHENPFLKEFLPFQKEIDRLGAYNSLSATVLKLGSCGVVDFYEGNELLNYRLVDPDNRRPVDFAFRKKELAAIKKSDPIALFASHELSRLKGYLHWKALNFRKQHRLLFLEGSYLPLEVAGEYQEKVVAFLRVRENEALIVIASRFFSITPLDWGDTGLLVSQEWIGYEWTEVFTGRQLHSFSATNMFKDLPVGFVYGKRCV